MKPGFIIYAMPRSRTYWLSRFLSYGGWSCWHEQAIFMRSIQDIKDILAFPGIGLAETAMAQGWRLFRHYNPQATVAVIRRPTAEVVDSMMAVNLYGLAHYERESLTRITEYGNRMLDEIALETPDALVLDCDDLKTESACKAIFEHCLPFEFDREWWLSLKEQNLQCDVAAKIRYYYQNKPEIEAFKKTCWRELRRLHSTGDIRRGSKQCPVFPSQQRYLPPQRSQPAPP